MQTLLLTYTNIRGCPSGHVPDTQQDVDAADPSEVEQFQVLSIILGHCDVLATLSMWLKENDGTPPPAVIDETMVEITALSQLSQEHYSALRYLCFQGVFDDNAWLQLSQTRPELNCNGGMLAQ